MKKRPADPTVNVFHVTQDGRVFPANTQEERRELFRLVGVARRPDLEALALFSLPAGEQPRVDTYQRPIHNGEFYDWLVLE